MTGVDVREAPGRGVGVFATRAFRPGETVLRARAVATTAERAENTMQVGPAEHAVIDQPAVFLNHACAPVLGLRDNAFGAYDFFALADIAPGDELTFDYAMSEWEVGFIEACRCGADGCRKGPLGFDALPLARRETYAPYLAGYLRAFRDPSAD